MKYFQSREQLNDAIKQLQQFEGDVYIEVPYEEDKKDVLDDLFALLKETPLKELVKRHKQSIRILPIQVQPMRIKAILKQDITKEHKQVVRTVQD